MTRSLALPITAALAAALLTGGCQQGPFQPKTAAKTAAPSTGVFQQPTGALASQMQDLNRRVGQLDLNNADLHRQLAQAHQDRQTSQEQVALLQKQLGEVASRLNNCGF